MPIPLLNPSLEAIGAVLKLVGEKWWHNAQRFILPPIYSAAVSFESGCLWLGLTTLPMIAPLCLGYKDYGPSNGFDRGAWLFMICVAAGLAPVLLGYLSWFFFVPWCIGAGIMGGVMRNMNNVIAAPISGAYIMLPIWFIQSH